MDDPALAEPVLVESNIVCVNIGGTGKDAKTKDVKTKDAKTWTSNLAARGVRAGVWNPTSLRLVTHRHLDDGGVKQVIAAFRDH